MPKYELLGKSLIHSFSPQIHGLLGAYHYTLRELPDEAALQKHVAARSFAGCNVTIPYKQAVMPLCDRLDKRAAEIGSVNTIVNRMGYLTGYNTDYEGFAYMLSRKGITLQGKTLLLLGDGATAKTARAVARDAGAAQILTASRSPHNGAICYEEAQTRQDVEVIINTSPVGTFPRNGECLIDLAYFPRLAAVADVVYNPLKTRLVLEAEKRGLPATGGLSMLAEQAVAAARLFTGRRFDADDTERILRTLYEKQACLVLVGMPSSGKTRLGRAASMRLRKPFVDLDRALEKKAGKPIPAIFAEDGEEAFRRLETEVLAEESKTPGRVLATGGGAVLKDENHYLLRQNGVVAFIDRPLQDLQTGGYRPLSKSPEALAEMEAVRRPLYQAAADITVSNTEHFGRVLHNLTEAFHAFFDS